jgi:osmoprotectant transport system ATP-binding protein
VLVTHDIDEALRLADHLVLMDHGEVVQQGSPLELLTWPKNDFVREFFGRSELGVRLLSCARSATICVGMRRWRRTVTGADEPAGCAVAFVARQCEVLPVSDARGRAARCIFAICWPGR